jgi:hypothetical protein
MIRAGILRGYWWAVVVGALAMGCQGVEASEIEFRQVALSGRDLPGRAAPIRVQVQGPDQVDGDEVEVVVVIEQAAPAPLRVQLQLPPGVELQDGSADETIADAGVRVGRMYRVRLRRGVPRRDLRVVVSLRGRGFGVRAVGQYRFGRPAPLLDEPARPGPSVIVQGHNLGSAIVLR